MKASETKNRPNGVDLKRYSGGQPQTRGTQHRGEELGSSSCKGAGLTSKMAAPTAGPFPRWPPPWDQGQYDSPTSLRFTVQGFSANPKLKMAAPGS